MTILDLLQPRTATSRYVPIVLLPLAMAVALAFVGAFGSYVGMSLPLRLLHFCTTSLAIGILAVVLSASLRRYGFAGAFPMWAAALVALVTAPLGGLIIQQSLQLLAPNTLRFVTLGELTGQVLLINLIIGAVTWILLRQPTGDNEGQSGSVQPAQADDEAREIRAKLPIALRRAPIVALSAEDHYVRVRTDRGEALILMNLSNAIDALGPDAGVRVHRSHWVSRALAEEAATTDSRHGIRVGKDTVLPVSRAGHKLLNEFRGSFAKT